ncbi:uncharacterized protein CTRU02_215529 [Colletotrichum truncatum]|uniref:Uncharacterized protein n=1 Tax=Colletotrichum truncatum TaxID=5467 RepID=A0ACC3YCS8_COLTU|nr:uncharacterized protein CTRU02_05527 [Colletotrichum truncatum]KAF6793970.1 hypothetical protein CTRU02_05527 [Colletotrichum truncatum]
MATTETISLDMAIAALRNAKAAGEMLNDDRLAAIFEQHLPRPKEYHLVITPSGTLYNKLGGTMKTLNADSRTIIVVMYGGIVGGQSWPKEYLVEKFGPFFDTTGTYEKNPGCLQATINLQRMGNGTFMIKGDVVIRTRADEKEDGSSMAILYEELFIGRLNLLMGMSEVSTLFHNSGIEHDDTWKTRSTLGDMKPTQSWLWELGHARHRAIASEEDSSEDEDYKDVEDTVAKLERIQGGPSTGTWMDLGWWADRIEGVKEDSN